MSVRLAVRLCLIASLLLLVPAAWLWWHETQPNGALLTLREPDIDLGAIAAGEWHIVKLPVENTSRLPVSLIGIDGELC